MTSYTHAEFLERELHSMVIDTGLYDWEEIWNFLRNRDAIMYNPVFQTFRWNDDSDYMQEHGVLYDLLDSYALDCLSVEKRYIAGEIWTRRTTFNAVTGRTRRVAYATDVHDLVVVYDANGTRQAVAGQFHDGKYLRDPDATWVETERAWNRA